MTAALLAHQGGWDEVMLVLAPIGLFAFLLHVANRRAGKFADEDTQSKADEPGEDSP